jgi:hypothetical protein
MSVPMVQLAPCRVNTVFVNRNAACSVEPLSQVTQNFDACDADAPPAQHPRRVYSVTSIPLHTYIAVSAKRIEDSDGQPRRSLIARISHWWTRCCLRGLSCII